MTRNILQDVKPIGQHRCIINGTVYVCDVYEDTLTPAKALIALDEINAFLIKDSKNWGAYA